MLKDSLDSIQLKYEVGEINTSFTVDDEVELIPVQTANYIYLDKIIISME